MRSLAVMAFAGFVAAGAFAQHQSFAVHPDVSRVTMTLNTTHEIVTGGFRVQSGSVEFDGSNSKMSGLIVVAAGSGKTGNDSRDRKMNNDILKVGQFTTILFEPKSYAGTIAPSGDSSIQVTGLFTLLGTAHEITIPIQVRIEGDAANAKAHFVVPYVQWGVKNPSFLVWKADNDVAIDLELVGTVSR